MANAKQIKGALESLIGAQPLPKKKPIKLQVDPKLVPEEESRVLSWEDMEIEKAKKAADEFSMDDQLAAMEESDAFANVMDQAHQMHTTAKQVYGEPRLPPTVMDGAGLQTALGPAYDKLIHFSDGAMEEMATIVRENGRGRTFLTHISDEDVGKITPKNKPWIGGVQNIEDTIRAYDYERGYPYIPRVPAEVDAAGDVVIQQPSVLDAQAWNAAISMAGIGFNPADLKYMPLVLDFKKPLFEFKKLSGVVKTYDDNGVSTILSGINVSALRRTPAPAKLEPKNSDWVDAPLASDADARARVDILFSDEAGKGTMWLWKDGNANDAAKLRGLIWGETMEQAPKRALPADEVEFYERSRASFWPKIEGTNTPMFDEWEPDARKAIVEYTKGSPYKARLVDPNAPKDAPLIIARGAQGAWEFKDIKTGERLDTPTMDPRLANEFGLHAGSLAQAEHFALRGTIHSSTFFPPYRREYQRVQSIGRNIIGRAISGDPKLKGLWDTFLDEVIRATRWGDTAPATGFADDVAIVVRPTHTTLESKAVDIIMGDEYTPLRNAIRAKTGSEMEAITKAASILHKGNMDISLYVTNVTRPLMMWDVGGFSMNRIIKQLMGKEEFLEDMPQLTEALRASDDMKWADQGFSNIANVMIRRILEKHGYDHIAYINTVEFPGTPSFVFWKKDTLRPIESFGVKEDNLKLLAGPSLAVGLAFKLSGKEEEKQDVGDVS